MKTVKLFSLILALAASQVLSSCLNSDNKGYTVTSNFTDMFNAVFTNDGNVTLSPKQSIKVDWVYDDNQVADLQIVGLQLPDLGAFPILQFDDLPWTINYKGWLDISFSNLKPTAISGFQTDLVFDRFNLQTVNRTYNNLNFPPCINISYTINDTYRVFTLPCEIIEIGETTVSDLVAGTTFVQPEESRSIYYIELDPSTNKGYLVIQGAQFASSMPGMNMKFPDIPFEVTPAGAILMQKDELVPALMSSAGDITQAGTPAPSYPITNLKISYMPDYGVTISFNCTPHDKEGQEIGKYAVVFSCLYPTASSSSN